MCVCGERERERELSDYLEVTRMNRVKYTLGAKHSKKIFCVWRERRGRERERERLFIRLLRSYNESCKVYAGSKAFKEDLVCVWRERRGREREREREREEKG